ncbi:MAG: class II aldolase/adducin family protein [Deltaproteobacteria bacterium]|nr:class II aldolase/adducin family protein [Deltaproteobacteria bacterium]
MTDKKELRIEVATCVRMLEYLGLIDFSGHVSARVPGTEDIFINSWGASRHGLGPGDIVRANLEGEPLGQGIKVPSEIHIHTSIYRRRTDVNAIAHIHPPATTILSIAGREYIPVMHHGTIFSGGVPVYDDCRHVNTGERGDALATLLGHCRALIMRGHGAVVVAETVKGAFFGSVYLEDNAQKLLEACKIGDPKTLSYAELEIGERLWRQPQFEKVWNYYQEKSRINFGA